MKNKKGFVFVETIIVITILTVALLSIYGSFTALMNQEKNRLHYEDATYLYRSYYIADYFRKFRFNQLKEAMSDGTDGRPVNMIVDLSCAGSGILSNNTNEIGFCESLLNEFHVSAVYLAINDLSSLKECTNQSGICESFAQMPKQTASYIKTISGKESGYRLIVEFLEKKDGSACDNTNINTCVYSHTTFYLGDLS